MKTRPCERWAIPVSSPLPIGRSASGVVVGTVPWKGKPTPTVFAAVWGPNGGEVYALRGSDGATLWKTPLVWKKEPSQTDIYAPVLVDVDGNGKRVLVVNANGPASAQGFRNDRVFALRTEDEGADKAGSIRWVFEYPRSAGAPIRSTSEAAVDLDQDGRPEIVIGDSTNTTAPARVYVIDGRDGSSKGDPVPGARRSERDPRRPADAGPPPPPMPGCGEINKMDSSSPSVAYLGGEPILLNGGWDGYLYALRWSGGSKRLEVLDRHELPLFDSTRPEDKPYCKIGKVRNSPLVLPGATSATAQVAFGYMYERLENAQDFETARFRIVELSASGFSRTAIKDFPTLRAWKSSPSLVRFAGTSDLGIVGGCRGCVFTLRASGLDFNQAPSVRAIGDMNLIGAGSVSWIPGKLAWGGNRSSPAVADIDGDGSYEMIIGVEGQADSPGLYAFDPANLAAPKWSVPIDGGGVTAAPAVADLDGDDNLEIAVLALDGKIHAYDDSCAKASH
jgi:hypothetical protein